MAEKSSVCLRGQAADDPLEVGQKAHVEHGVGFIEDERVQLVETGLVLAHVVEEPAGGGEEDLDAGAQGLFLVAHGSAADKDADAQRRVVRQAKANVIDLLSQFAGGRDDEGLADAARLGQEPVQDRQQKGGGLAGARLGRGNDVAPGQNGGDSLGLDGRGLLVAHFVHGLHQGRVQAQALERHEKLPGDHWALSSYQFSAQAAPCLPRRCQLSGPAGIFP